MSGGATIGRVRLCGRDPGQGPVALRLRLERLLAGGALEAPGMAPGEVLVVRGLRRSAPLGEARPGPGWAAGLRAELGELARGAHRPALRAAPSDALAVRFADMAELLACLTRDLLAGRGDAWYWRRLLAGAPRATGPGLAAAWAGQARALPAAAALLAPAELLRAGRALAAHEAHAVLRALWAAFELPGPPPPALGAPQPALAAQPPLAPSAPPREGPAWAPWLPRALAGTLAPESARLIAMAAMLRAAPAFARTPAVAARLAAAPLCEGAPAGDGPAPAAPPPPSGAAPRRVGAGPSTAEPAQLTADTATLPSGTGSVAPGRAGGAAGLAPPALGAARQPAQAAREAAATRPPPASAPAGAREGAAPATPPAPRPAPGGLLTGLGGAFYLINLLAWLELPGGWGAGQPTPAELGGWGLVEGLARGLLGPAHGAHRDDPIWALLADLAGRPAGAPLGDGLSTPQAFAPPERLLRRLGLAPLAATGAPEEGAARDLSGRAPAEPTLVPEALAPELLAHFAPAAAWWLARALTWARAVLARLGVAGGPAELAAALAVPGRVERSRTHLDVTLPLERIALPVRRAGLDCSPGWAPDLGLIVTLHFR